MKNYQTVPPAKTTRAGRIVYDRKKHEMGLKDVVRMCERLSIRLKVSELKRNPYICNALFEIVRTAFYPYWQMAANPGIDMDTNYNYYEYRRRVVNRMQTEWKEKTFELCHEIGNFMAIPSGVQNLVINYFGNFIWEVIWKITSTFDGRR